MCRNVTKSNFFNTEFDSQEQLHCTNNIDNYIGDSLMSCRIDEKINLCYQIPVSKTNNKIICVLMFVNGFLLFSISAINLSNVRL
jgi:hypothetical protein